MISGYKHKEPYFMSSTLTGADALVKIKELEAEASQVQQEADKRLGEIMAKIRDTANSASGDLQLGNGAPKSEAITSDKNTASEPTAQRTAVKKATKGKGSKLRANAQPLREVIWDILAKTPHSWKKIIPDLPKGVIGLKAVELKEIIESEGSWKSGSNIANQISSHLKAYRKAEKMELGEQKRYNIVDGAEFE